MLQQRWSGVVVAGLLALTAGAAGADDRALALTYEVPDACVDEATLRAEVTARRPSARFAADGAVLAIARVRDAPEGFVAELTILEPGAAAASRLYPPVDHCQLATTRLADALVALFTDLPPPAVAPGEVPSPRTERPPESMLEVAAGGTTGANPTAAPTLALSVRAIGGPWSSGGRVRLTWDTEDLPGSTRKISSYNVEAMAEVCTARRWLHACGAVGLGGRQLSVASTNDFFHDGYSDFSGYGLGGGRVGLALPLTARVLVIPAVEVLWVSSQPSFQGFGADSYSATAQVALAFGLGGRSAPPRSQPPKSQPGP